MGTREIKFRGKDADNDHEWKYGSLIVCPDGSPVIVCFDDDGCELSYDVVPATVGQFTGLYDKNGKEIYEGDILREPETGILVEVVYDAPEFCFRHNAHEYRFLNHPERFEVLGNIFDNPGLLEGGWRIAAVWHDARKEVPEKCKPILTERKSGIFSVNISGGNMESCPLSWARWAYISDLIPDRKEGGR